MTPPKRAGGAEPAGARSASEPLGFARVLEAIGPGAVEVTQRTLSADSTPAPVAEMDAARADAVARASRHTLALAVDHWQ